MLSLFLSQHGYDCKTAGSAEEARATMQANPDVQLVLTDLDLPGQSGFDLIGHLAQDHPDTSVMMLTGLDDPQLASAALARGAYGYMIKPFKPTEVVVNVANALRRRSLEIENHEHRMGLQKLVSERTSDLWNAVTELERAQTELQVSRQETIERLSMAAEFRDDETARHIQRMSRYCALLGAHFGWDDAAAEQLRLASVMHDVGKIGIPDSILLKPGPLTPDEYTKMQEHCEIGYRILSGSHSELLKAAASIALTHHEKMDGSGYPQGLSLGIPLEGRIAAVADVFDALTTDRIYRAALPLDEAVALMKKGRGSHFDPDILDFFLDSMEEVLTIKGGAGT
jgi:putative two-component system response regulator